MCVLSIKVSIRKVYEVIYDPSMCVCVGIDVKLYIYIYI